MDKKYSNRLYYKLLLIYTGIILMVVSVLVSVFLSSYRKRVIENNESSIRMLSEDSSEYMSQAENRVDYVMEELYKSTTELDDILAYLTLDTEEYLEFALDTYGNMNGVQYKGIEDFSVDMFASDSRINRIAFVSYPRKEVTVHYPDKRVQRNLDYNLVFDRLEQNNLADIDEFSFAREIRRPDTWETVGCIIVSFSGKRLKYYDAYYEDTELLVYNKEGTIIYDSSGKYEDSSLLIGGTEAEWMEKRNLYAICDAIGDYETVAYMPVREMDRLPFMVLLSSLFFSMLAVVGGETAILYYLSRLEKRLNGIVAGMEQVTQGNLDVSLKVNKRGDELDIISDHFNGMCRELDRYIQKSYLAEIEQKNAEMEALQSQINPHFLYNTLEAIRMKAIINGDREVAKMIYSMTIMFRSQVKESPVITLVQELHYCKKYMDLFKIRYQNQFSAEIECREELYQLPIIKFVLQPLVENYFIHGMRKEDSDNVLKITVKEDSGDICIVVEDNGRGMDDADIKQKNQELKENSKNKDRSIGVANVNRRIRAVYGESYGITLEHAIPRGMRVILRYRPGRE